MQEDRSQSLLSAALSYAKRGWHVFPLHSPRNGRCSCRRETCASPAKHPRTKHGLKDAATDEAVIRRWWTLWRDANIGVCTGARSGLVVIDVDPAHGGEESLADLERRYGAPPKTVMARTGGGGRHLLFAHPGVPIRNKVQVAGLPGLDVRGDGGYIVAPPSVHISRRAYAWDPAGDPARVSLAPLPAWLLAFLQTDSAGQKPSRTPEAWRELVAQGAGEGARNVTIASLAGYLLHRDVDPLVTLELLQAWNAARNQPPLSAEEVAQVVESIAGREYRRRREKQD